AWVASRGDVSFGYGPCRIRSPASGCDEHHQGCVPTVHLCAVRLSSRFRKPLRPAHIHLRTTEPPAEHDGWLRGGASGAVVDRRRGHFFRSKRSRFITFVQAATKSRTTFGPASSVA